MNLLRHFLLVFALVFAQLAAGAHAVEHVASDAQGLPSTHACELCLVAHNLGSGLPVVLALPPVVPVVLAPDATVPAGRFFLLPPLARQGAPPFA